MWHSNVSELDKAFSSRRGLKSPAARELDREKDFPKGTFDLQGPELNVLIRDKIYFVGVQLICSLNVQRKILFAGAVSRSPMHNSGILETVLGKQKT